MPTTRIDRAGRLHFRESLEYPIPSDFSPHWTSVGYGVPAINITNNKMLNDKQQAQEIYNDAIGASHEERYNETIKVNRYLVPLILTLVEGAPIPYDLNTLPKLYPKKRKKSVELAEEMLKPVLREMAKDWLIATRDRGFSVIREFSVLFVHRNYPVYVRPWGSTGSYNEYTGRGLYRFAQQNRDTEPLTLLQGDW